MGSDIHLQRIATHFVPITINIYGWFISTGPDHHSITDMTSQRIGGITSHRTINLAVTTVFKTV